ncbi:Lipoamide acyltransferase component of branched-chain alpha-keto acid dehydrogenase complex [Thalassovita autumnalis]|uniref:Dihydrolipoamide acetyltransferase component of pyruvate dehydrogenase complex n=1 Tax=Thalassovita autumnalis TaxID=2072972 RepID=A0A0P1FJK5_9RHOB|nr:dihydrolipoamide acetyltransferase family protein [Thalassovita autumnalis]CUH62465.1 Lipoamide acyltransferase component of branched-chain alpha-keto acid dehydrogenase complex [Thalassovita autumnalis]CUH70292.1 Lipoamide acyltransferase component of branched-chain alpha-keto acid dehydrogenase complex [Thalassovita autumnalis]
MGIHAIRLPDIGEGIAEAELTEWQVKPGDIVKEDDILAVVMTDKAAVEVPSSVEGKVVELGGEIGTLMAVGAVLIRIEVDGEGNEGDIAEDAATPPAAAPAPKPEVPKPAAAPAPKPAPAPAPSAAHIVARAQGTKPLASPSVRGRARDEGIDLRQVTGSGPAGRISHEDLDRWIASGGIQQGGVTRAANTGIEEVRVIGMRRKIAEKMQISKRQIPHITIVEEVEMEALESLRAALNAKHKGDRPKLTILPFLMRAIVEAVREQPELNARYDDEAGVIHRHGGVHVGIATQTPNGLNVPVIRHAEAGSLWDNATELGRLADAARDGTIKIDELQGGTITITSLGPLGALATTPIINHPEVAIVGVNKMQIRPVWDGQQFQPRKMMNISCSFDHRVIDGWDAAVFVQKLKTLLETPAMLFVEG